MKSQKPWVCKHGCITEEGKDAKPCEHLEKLMPKFSRQSVDLVYGYDMSHMEAPPIIDPPSVLNNENYDLIKKLQLLGFERHEIEILIARIVERKTLEEMVTEFKFLNPAAIWRLEKHLRNELMIRLGKGCPQ